ncbi:cytosolic phospholipase A2 gamma-like isoform X2 [Plectropomus leopardus]|nr:cytosolic phospholipase A2 gamma-like isoform X2 [Plectropomus leopardus]
MALLGSGGGQRAAVGLMGSLYQMKKEDLLDTLLYLGGVSGSTWSMTSIYSDPQWSTNVDAAVSRLSGPGVDLDYALVWLDEKAKEEYFSLTDVWGVLTSAGIMKQMDLRHLSDEMYRNATNPYPIYSAMENDCSTGNWFEMSPHEAGFTELDVFIETSLLGSKFKNGELLEKMPEMDIVQLQGILGCALADKQAIINYIPAWLKEAEFRDAAAEEYLRVYNIQDQFLDLTRSTINDPVALSELDQLQKLLEEYVNQDKTAMLLSRSTEETRSLFQGWSLGLVNTVETWSHSLENATLKTHATLLTKYVLPKILKWEWGTTANFLHQYQDSTVPSCLSSNERIHLVDAGFLINVGYPPFLGDKRDIDLIIAPEYSAGNMFETLTLARDHAAEMKMPFPEIDDKILEDRDWPKDCYVFEGKENEPTIIYLPLFNRQNCKDAKEFKVRMDDFSTFQRPYSQEKIESLLEVAKANIKNNKETLLREINKAVLRRHNKRSSVLN